MLIWHKHELETAGILTGSASRCVFVGLLIAQGVAILRLALIGYWIGAIIGAWLMILSAGCLWFFVDLIPARATTYLNEDLEDSSSSEDEGRDYKPNQVGISSQLAARLSQWWNSFKHPLTANSLVRPKVKSLFYL